MKHDSSQANKSLHPWIRRSLFLGGAAWVGSFTVLGSGFVVAQTDSLVDSGAASEPAPAPAPEPAPAPQAEAPAPAPAPEPAPRVITPPPAPRQSAPVRRESPPEPRQSAPVRRESSPEPRQSAPSRRVSTPEPTRQASPAASDSPKLSAPRVSVPSTSTEEIPAQLVDRPPSQAPQSIQRNARFSDSGTNNLIDNFGSPSNAQRPTVVVTERSTGCQTVVRGGQLAEGSCGRAAVRNREAASSNSTASSGRSSVRQSLDRGSPSVAVENGDRPSIERPTAIGSRRTRTIDLQPTGIPVSARSRVRAVPTNIAYAPQTTVADYYSSGAPRPEALRSSGETALLFPLSIPAQISSGFGFRVHPILGTQRFHSGTDIAAPQGTPVLAAYPGEVALADNVGGYGLMVAIRHEDGTQESRYAHLSQIFVHPGDRVERGDVIGLVGSTGLSTGPHLHFEWLHQMPTGWVAVDAGEHLEYALRNMIASIPPADITAEAKGTLQPHDEVEFNFPTDAEIAANKAKAAAEARASDATAPATTAEAIAPEAPTAISARSARPAGISRGL